MEEVSLTIDEAKRERMADELLRQRFNTKTIIGELGHEHKFITKIIARRANDCIISITEPDYKNLNKNDIEDIYLLIIIGKKVNLTAPTITFPGIEEHDMFSIIFEPMHGIIYKNSKKEKRVMRHTEIHKFCDVTLNRVLEDLKSYNNDVKYGYAQKYLTKDETEYLKLFEEEIEERLKHQRQMRRWEVYVNGRPRTSPIFSSAFDASIFLQSLLQTTSSILFHLW
ncbi:hypothetical protein Tco_0435923 [Tanacetum coccineum]